MERFVNVDRQTPMLLPPDLRDWVADNELAHLIVDAVELCDLRGAQRNERGSGSEQYPPSMMLGLLIYAYATGVFSSRRIERGTYESVAMRYLCANHHPDHDTIAKFRVENGKLFESCFGQVLMLAREAGVLRVGVVSVDGTRMAGAGSAKSVRRLEEIERELQALGRELLKKAEAVDAQDEDGGGTQLPVELSNREQRRRKLLAAKAAIMGRRQEAQDAGRRGGRGSGRESKSASVSEPQSRCLGRKGGSSVQGYNAQAVIDAGKSGLIVGARLSDATNDYNELEPTLQSLAPEAGQAFAVMADKGYDRTEEIVEVQRNHGVLVLCPPQRRPNAKENNPHRRGHRKWVWQQRRTMEQRFLCPLLLALYRRRQPSAESVFARIKTHLGFRRFHVWGKKAAGSEWMLVCLAHNCRMLTGQIA